MKSETTTVHICETCGKEFLKKSSCARHEPGCKKKFNATEKRRKELQDISDYIRLNCDSIHQLEKMIMAHVDKYYPNTGLSIHTFHVRGFVKKSDHRRDHIYIRVDGEWKSPPQRDSSFKASFTDLFNNWPDLDFRIGGFETGSGGSGGGNFGYGLYLMIDEFPKLKKKLKSFGELAEKKAIYDEEQARLHKIQQEFIGRMCIVNADRIVLGEELRRVDDDMEKLQLRKQQLNKDLKANYDAICTAAWEENEELLTPEEKFRYDQKAYNDCKSSLGL